MKAIVFHDVGDIRMDDVPEPQKVLTRIEPLTNAIEAYKAFDERQAGWMKVTLEPVLCA